VTEDGKPGRPSYQDLQSQIAGLKSKLDDKEKEPESSGITELEARLVEVTKRAQAAESQVKEIEADLKRQESLNKARMNQRIRKFPGVDWSKPAFKMIGYVRKADGSEAPQDGEIKFEDIGHDGKKKGDVVLTFQDGLCVTNDLKAARAYTARGWVFELSPVEYPGEREKLPSA